jgi:hypothetical protein
LPAFTSRAQFSRPSRSRCSSSPSSGRCSGRIPRLLALVATLAATLLVVTVLGYLIVWAFGTIGRWLIENALRLQGL